MLTTADSAVGCAVCSRGSICHSVKKKKTLASYKDGYAPERGASHVQMLLETGEEFKCAHKARMEREISCGSKQFHTSANARTYIHTPGAAHIFCSLVFYFHTFEIQNGSVK